MTTPPSRSHGRLSMNAAAAPRELMTDRPRLASAWEARVITLFPETFPGILGASLTGRALDAGLWRLETIDLRGFGEGRHRNVDDTPAGGGAGMVLRADVVGRALDHAARGTPRSRGDWPVVYLSPRGRRFDQGMAERFSAARGITLLCGRFEGVDQRVLDAYEVEEVSLGDFVLTGGEIAAQALLDATVRLIPRVLGNEASAQEESFSDHLLEHSQYTRPALWEGREIPEILLSGHHGRIDAWRRDMAERLTKERRPDLWRAYCAAHGRDPDEDREL
ncbi:tRNA (guanosine(37)-N1)-methyltransferase TrmD [Profundibacterium mesophilum]|uniref:tRNA (guanine-N(1)-)-methyltransferase n=1 Tax=Profundibacterium mesophilum KAUST100406-0324 TaxID=1037889 RepID=A0A921NWV5_9RHOB|nr:tRNA (guanosine(37)-N1)-methyltransferase TrmD [Profundibacterium mesophilum]KAF0676915.1 tRNA -methyltransferase [Profundibacterium mesophilum KAUST100406-0324]